MNAATVRHILETMEAMFPDAHCELNHSNAFELTVAVLLSAQCTDETVNKVTADLFQKYRSPSRLSGSSSRRVGTGYSANRFVPEQGQAYSEHVPNFNRAVWR